MAANATTAGFGPPLDGFRIGSLVIPDGPSQRPNCQHIAGLLTPLSADEIRASNPAMADIGLVTFLGVFNHQLPSPLDTATTAQLLGWWRTSLETDREDATAFLRAVTKLCMQNACSSTTGIGEADIAGIGIYAANTMLALLVIVFWVFGLVHSPGLAHRARGWRHDCAGRALCQALRATVDDVFDGALVFSTSLHVATLSYQFSTAGNGTTRYEVTFAQTSCTFAALCVMSLWHVRRELTRPRAHSAVFFFAMCALALAVFVLRCLYWLYPTTFWDETCVNPASEAWWHGRAFMDFLCTVYFAVSVVFTALPFQRWATCLKPGRAERRAVIARKGLLTKLRIFQSFFGTFGIFFYIFVMNAARNGFEDENKWGIGQYLAVASWIPSIIKIAYFLCVPTMETALTNHLPLPWKAHLPPGDDDKNEENMATGAASQSDPSAASADTIGGLEEGVMTRRNTGLAISLGSDLPPATGGLLVRRDSDMTVVGDEPEPVKLKDAKN